MIVKNQQIIFQRVVCPLSFQMVCFRLKIMFTGLEVRCCTNATSTTNWLVKIQHRA